MKLNPKGAKSANLNPIAACHRASDLLENCVDDLFGVA